MAFVVGTETGRSLRPAMWAFTLTVFLSASLLFFVQPLFARIVLPAIGGSPAVWTTAMLFFQSALLGGYLYAHFSARYLPLPVQVGLHLLFWVAALFFLPPALPADWQLDATRPIAWQTLGLFALGVGVPFALLSSNAPLIQSWYAHSNGPSADDPYFLYSASNLGSVLALLAFPLVAEPFFGASSIARGFAIGFIALGIGLVVCGGLILGRNRLRSSASLVEAPAPDVSTIICWGLLAFVPSSMMLAVTSKISTDIGAVPLVWVIPLALFLLSFVIAFRSSSHVSGRWFTQLAQLVGVAALCLTVGALGDHLTPFTSAAFVFSFFVIAIWAHRALYEARPTARHLTTFYVTMSVGGAMGGVFNSIVGPLMFDDHVEGTLTLILMLLLVFGRTLRLDAATVRRGVFMGLPIGLAAAGVAFIAGGSEVAVGATIAVALGILAVARPALPVLAVAATLTVILPLWLAAQETRIFADRSFFGLHQVIDGEDGIRRYSNGTTVHGAQRFSDLGAPRPMPITYYHPDGPMGQIMQTEFAKDAKTLGVVGLGVGSLACYATDGQDWHFYEIDAIVDRIARDPDLFSFLSSCTPDAPTHLGDARVVLADQDDMLFDILVIDAYSSDAVPVHLTTLEAMELYLDRLAPGGVLLFHISNRFYDIGLPLGRSAETLGVHAWRQLATGADTDDAGFLMSDVALITRDPNRIAELLRTGPWRPLASDGGPVWTDDKANPLSILKPGALKP
ncbi:MAG: fused MFS/spermidine synthase [Pseudomonadota bacterium]